MSPSPRPGFIIPLWLWCFGAGKGKVWVGGGRSEKERKPLGDATPSSQYSGLRCPKAGAV